ncbi:MAG: WYL domain-containing protein [Clostridia bacterium]|nr:WYL domain-containing protein [Clostridia bacterium]
MRVHRLIHILMKIDQEGKVKAQDIAEELEVSSRTIYRDVEVLCEAGFPILTTTGQKGGITFIDGYKLNLDQTEVTMKTLITHLYAMPEQERLIHALENGMRIKYKSNEGLGDESKQKILIDKKSWWEEASTEIDLQPIMKALFLQQKLSIRYSQSDGTQTDRIIAPYGLVLKYTTWYLVAFCYSRNEIRTFNCSRINYTGYLKGIYEIPDDFVLKDYWDLSTKAFIESRKESEYFPVEIKVHEVFWPIFEHYDIIGIKKTGDFLIGMIDLHRKDVAEEDIRAFLCYGQILYPEEMVIKAREILKSSIQMYHNI